MNHRCPHCGFLSVILDVDVNARQGQKLCQYCLLCGRRRKMNGIRYVTKKE